MTRTEFFVLSAIAIISLHLIQLFIKVDHAYLIEHRERFTSDERINTDVKADEAPKVILHVGPGKMGTTTIQNAMAMDLEELSKDNFCLYKPLEFVKIGRLINNDAHPEKYTVAEMLDHEEIKEMLDYFDHCHNMKQHMLLSSESLGLLETEVWEGVLKPSLKRWNITIAVGYRRFYSWAPSLWFQIMKKRVSKRWPEKDDEIIMSFHDWYQKRGAQEKLKVLYTDSYIDHWKGLDRRFYSWAPSIWFQIMRQRVSKRWPEKDDGIIMSFHDWYRRGAQKKLKVLYTDSYIDHWKGLGIENFLIYNMHEDPNLMKHFYCSKLGLNHTCDKHSGTLSARRNVGHSLQSDRLACALYSHGYINSNKTNRVEAGKMISEFFSKKDTPLEQISPICFTDGEMNEVLKRSVEKEAELLPDFHISSKGMVTMADELHEDKDKNFCDVNITDVIDQHGKELKALFVYR
eukprot:CAMPEP_0195538270 /NCGR_PEP_ID=MMETSP0794_2-20130614/49437_1 /TAXON_ID=515487 /ORGANISM="Stephanopyxis turris, Strain CCMP 815" /LENGTH=460 /DNA_ID=CAMNT_0040672239 /DNA_START=327 /DNA_END=1709 /DNA_ORIENTATION=-